MTCSKMVACFVSAVQVSILVGKYDLNDQNIQDAILENYGEEIENLCQDEQMKEGDVREVDHGIYISKMNPETTKEQGIRLAGFLGFERDHVREDTWYGVVDHWYLLMKPR